MRRAPESRIVWTFAARQRLIRRSIVCLQSGTTYIHVTPKEQRLIRMSSVCLQDVPPIYTRNTKRAVSIERCMNNDDDMDHDGHLFKNFRRPHFEWRGTVYQLIPPYRERFVLDVT